jgi:hypothetical protein
MSFHLGVDDLLNVVLPAIGLVLLVTSVLILLHPRGSALNTKQHISGFGLELDVTVIAMLILIGGVCLLIGVYSHVTGLTEQNAQLRKDLDLAKTKDIRVRFVLTLDGVSKKADEPNLSVLQCTADYGHQGNETLLVGHGDKAGELAMHLNHMSPGVNVTIDCQDNMTQPPREWIATLPYGLEFRLPAALSK